MRTLQIAALSAFVSFFNPLFLIAAPVDPATSAQTVAAEDASSEDEEISEIREIVPLVELDVEEVYQSSYIDVSDFRYAAFYVMPAQAVLNAPEPVLWYQLDAFFSIVQDSTTIKKMGEKKGEFLHKGWQEFGVSRLGAGAGQSSTGIPSLIRTSTGKVAGRALYTPVYGPYVRVELKNLTEKTTAKFRIVAYLSK